jgi:hypothetical protein
VSGWHKGKLALAAANTMHRAGPRQLASLAAAASPIALVKNRKRVGLPSGVATVSAFAIAPTLAAGFRRSRVRDGIVWAAQMWACGERVRDAERQRAAASQPRPL